MLKTALTPVSEKSEELAERRGAYYGRTIFSIAFCYPWQQHSLKNELHYNERARQTENLPDPLVLSNYLVNSLLSLYGFCQSDSA